MMNSLPSNISTFRSALLAATLAFTSLTASLQAQVANTVKVDVPFAFQNGSETLPAGTYTIAENNRILHIQGQSNSGLAMARTEVSGPGIATTGKVVFQRVGDKYFLSEVWQRGQSRHAVCITTSAENKARKEFQAKMIAGKVSAPAIEIAAK